MTVENDAQLDSYYQQRITQYQTSESALKTENNQLTAQVDSLSSSLETVKSENQVLSQANDALVAEETTDEVTIEELQAENTGLWAEVK